MAKRHREFLHCPPYEGIGREEAADVRKQAFIRRASSMCVRTYDVPIAAYAFAAAAFLWQTGSTSVVLHSVVNVSYRFDSWYYCAMH